MADNLAIKNIASYAELRTFNHSSLFGNDWQFGIPALGVPAQQFGFTRINSAPGYNSGDQSTATKELRLQGAHGADR